MFFPRTRVGKVLLASSIFGLVIAALSALSYGAGARYAAGFYLILLFLDALGGIIVSMILLLLDSDKRASVPPQSDGARMQLTRLTPRRIDDESKRSMDDFMGELLVVIPEYGRCGGESA